MRLQLLLSFCLVIMTNDAAQLHMHKKRVSPLKVTLTALYALPHILGQATTETTSLALQTHCPPPTFTDALTCMAAYETFAPAINHVTSNESERSHSEIISQNENRFTVQKKRYPVVFKTFLARTNEKDLSREVIVQFMRNLYAEYPDYFENTLRIFDIGCGDGHFSRSIIREVGHIKPQGLRDVAYAGMDHQISFVDATNALMQQEGIVKPSVIVGDFKADALPESALNSANLVLASHFAYIFSDMDIFIQKVEAILQKNGIAIFVHGGKTPIDDMLQQFTSFVRPAATSWSTPLKLQKALAQAKLEFHAFDFQPILYFPRISNDEWELLQAIQSDDYAADYTNWSSELKDAKHLMEFFLQDPLEAFSDEQRIKLVQGFKKVATQNNYELPLLNVMHVVVARGSETTLYDSITKPLLSMHLEDNESSDRKGF